jgi:hypothetical protein
VAGVEPAPAVESVAEVDVGVEVAEAVVGVAAVAAVLATYP